MEKAKKLVEALIKANMHISFCESCTGGMLSAALTEIPGSSAVFDMGFVTYANEAKNKLIGVNKALLDTYGAVSEEVAKAMAEGVVRVSGADIGVSITGIAGPDGGSEEKPVGLVYIGMCFEGKVVVTKNNFSGSRQQIREKAMNIALSMALDELYNKLSKKSEE